MEADVETDPAWLERLYSLNGVIVASGERLAGSICYEHHSTTFERERPVALNRTKRERFRLAAQRATRMLEIGVNGGHSAYVALSANSDLEFHGVDIGEHKYVRPAVEWLMAEFPDRVFFYEGSCLEILPELHRRGMHFDCFHIDGGKHTYYRDILNCHRLAEPHHQSLIIVDDFNFGPVQTIWRLCIRQGLVKQSPDFPPMDRDAQRQNAVGTLEPISTPRWWAYRLRLALVTARRKFLARS
ncbi:MAG TPA: class I SAM-dependent methyltransferase [Solirubrobacteraceae bacterium]